MSAAVCHRCGGAKGGALDACPDCGTTPVGRDRLVAWLFSDAWLNEDERAEAARRVLAGEQPDPGRAQLAEARRALLGEGRHPTMGAPLTRAQAAGLLAVNLLFTPLAGLAVWLGKRSESPRAARQALWLTAPVMALSAAVWLTMLATRLR